MASTRPYARFKKMTERLNGLFFAGGLIFLPAMMILTVCDVVCRYLFSAPIPGSGELNELMLLTLITLGLGYAHREKANVKITLLLNILPDRAKAFSDMITGLLGLVISAFLSACSFFSGIEEFHADTATDMLSVPLYPFKFVLAVGCLLLFLAILEDFLEAGKIFTNH